MHLRKCLDCEKRIPHVKYRPRCDECYKDYLEKKNDNQKKWRFRCLFTTQEIEELNARKLENSRTNSHYSMQN